MALLVATLLLLTTSIGYILCDAMKPERYVQSNLTDAFENIEISNQYINYNPTANRILIKNVGFGPFGASNVNIVLQNLPSNAEGDIEFRLDGVNQEPIGSVAVSPSQLRNSATVTPSCGVHDLYVKLPNGLTPVNLESITFTSAKPKPDQYYYIIQHYSENALSLNGEVRKVPLVQSKLRGHKYQQFRFAEVRNGVYKIVSKLGQALQVKFSQPVELVDEADSQFQLWVIEQTGEGVVRLKSAVVTGYDSCMAIERLSKDEGIRVKNEVCKGSQTEYWWLVPSS